MGCGKTYSVLERKTHCRTCGVARPITRCLSMIVRFDSVNHAMARCRMSYRQIVCFIKQLILNSVEWNTVLSLMILLRTFGPPLEDISEHDGKFCLRFHRKGEKE
ncbi:hypothetical protein BX666DRAFT_1514616 [Dichotomocladium elegans]|nr:hypothetical protein BX666DRAFT_1514616 [Dichotomocladium elegans]